MAIMRKYQAEKCCHPVRAYKPFAGCTCTSVRQFLIHSTFVVVSEDRGLGIFGADEQYNKIIIEVLPRGENEE